ncbi:MAG: type II toxin-antitoxin system VapC family toxin [Pseudomonadales bacterium]
MILLDTHVLLWADQDSERLGSETRRTVDSAFAESGVAVSAIAFWEIAMLRQKARLKTSLDLASWRRDLLTAGLVELAVDGATGIEATRLEQLHGDPADRIILATAIRNGATLLTADQRLLDWPGTLPRQDARN